MMMYCLKCDENYDEPTINDNVCPNCMSNQSISGAPLSNEEKEFRERRYNAVIDLTTKKMLEGTQNGLLYAYKDSSDLLDRLGFKKGLKVIKKHFEDAKNEKFYSDVEKDVSKA